MQYIVNGTVSTIWTRVQKSKTFWVCSLFVLGAAVQVNTGQMPVAQFLQVVQVGVVGILLRSALAKAEIASNAANPDVDHITAE